jgi:hypothetical protein
MRRMQRKKGEREGRREAGFDDLWQGHIWRGRWREEIELEGGRNRRRYHK